MIMRIACVTAISGNRPLPLPSISGNTKWITVKYEGGHFATGKVAKAKDLGIEVTSDFICAQKVIEDIFKP